MEKCIFCGSNATSETHSKDDLVFCSCNVCGRYAINDFDTITISKYKITAYLYHNIKLHANERPSDYTAYIGYDTDYQRIHSRHQHYHLVRYNEIESFWPRKFADRIDKILLALSTRSRFFGEQMQFSQAEMHSLLFVVSYDGAGKKYDDLSIDMQLSEVTEYLVTNEYVKISSNETCFFVTLLANGWRRVDDLQQKGNDRKAVFVSMSFASSTSDTREAIRKGIDEAGCSPEFIDEIIHNHQIVPEMLRLIRECRFLILEISEPNYGAYFEAGYAMGLGKEVIITCNSEVFNKKYENEDDKKYEKYLKPHFDIAQKQILVWNDYDDLAKKLCEWIKAIVR